mgnify:CR=1 FL=1
MKNTNTKKEKKEKIDKLKFIDLFAGTGAFSLSLEKNKKFKCVFANDMMVCSQKIYELNNPSHKFTLKDLLKASMSNCLNFLFLPTELTTLLPMTNLKHLL